MASPLFAQSARAKPRDAAYDNTRAPIGARVSGQPVVSTP
ncbi:hypothetical protein PM01_08075 [Sulfitobacter pontiacus 3SOLIMAR09]|nr:hypothetical protein PM01_08075 [Sulfitobacter pontiacus 3SOLIMAR09]